MTDAWDNVATSQIVSPRKARMRAAEKRKQKQLLERNLLFRLWEKWHADRKTKLLAGKWSAEAQELAGFLEAMTADDAGALIELVARGPWREADADTKFLVLQMIDGSIIRLRESAGLSPFDDALPWSDEEPTAFMIIREELR